jgi:hypothetical protein
MAKLLLLFETLQLLKVSPDKLLIIFCIPFLERLKEILTDPVSSFLRCKVYFPRTLTNTVLAGFRPPDFFVVALANGTL